MKTEGSHHEERQRPARSCDGESVEEIARRVDLINATRGLVGVRNGASGSKLRGEASRIAASPLTAQRATRLTMRRTAQPAVLQSAQAFAGSLQLQAQRS